MEISFATPLAQPLNARAQARWPIAQREQHAHLVTKRVLPPDQWTHPANASRATPRDAQKRSGVLDFDK
jgi:hypothetical protein